MLNLTPDICLRFKEARKAKGLNQTALARLVGCKQSALSEFEGGMGTKLSDEIVKKMADQLGVSLDPSPVKAVIPQVSAIPGIVIHGFCPDCNCPSNIPFIVAGKVMFRSSRLMASPIGGKYCAQCGEVLETCCPNCGAALNEGACCTMCGNAYVTPVIDPNIDITTYVWLYQY